MKTTKSSGIARRAAVTLICAVLAMLSGPTPSASAHGEQTQEAFLRASTVLLYDVRYSDTKVNVGDKVTITGKLRVMNAWPEHTIKAPEIGFLSIIAPGPVFGVEDRRLNDTFTPQSVEVRKGQTFPFSLTVVAREEGHWHVHPSFAVEGTGTLVGRGEWIDVGPGEYTNTAVLASGEKVDLNSYGNTTVWTWLAIAIVIGLAWLVFWLRRPLLARLAVVQSGEGRSLTGKRDVAIGIGFAVLVFAVLAGGYVYTTVSAKADPMPLQVARIAPAAAEQKQTLVSASVKNIDYHPSKNTLELTVDVHNTSEHAVRLSQLQVAEQSLGPAGSNSPGSTPALTLSDDIPIPAGERKTLQVVIDTDILKEHNLLPLQEPQVRLTGLLFFTDSEGNRQVSEVDEVTSPILPSSGGGH